MFFFFSSRRRHTRYWRDWSSDVCSSDLQKSGRYDSLFVAAESTDHVTQVEKEIRDIYGADIGITTSQAILQSIGEFTAGFGTAISSIALVALLVGSVGIVTTMYTSVTERTREIGVMKAIGARDRNVLALFLTEAAIIGIVGASIGLVIGVLGGYRSEERRVGKECRSRWS